MNPDTGSQIESRYLRHEAAAKRLGICPRTLSIWQRKRIVPFRKIGRAVLFRSDELDAAVDRFRVNAIGEPPTPRKRHTERNATGEHTIPPA